jgi:hypothetical protein
MYVWGEKGGSGMQGEDELRILVSISKTICTSLTKELYP